MKKYYKHIILIFFSLFIQVGFSQTYKLDNSINGTTIPTCSGSFYDSGGSGNRYSTNENRTVTFCSSSIGQQLRFDFTTLDIGAGDALLVYDGTSSSAPLLFNCSSCTSSGYLISTSGCLTFVFTSDNSGNRPGWAATISCYTPITNDDCSGAISLPVNTTCVNTVASNLGATSSSSVSSPTCGGYSGGDIWYSFVAPVSGSVTINTSSISGGPTDMDMALYSGTCGSLSELECDDWDGPGVKG